MPAPRPTGVKICGVSAVSVDMQDRLCNCSVADTCPLGHKGALRCSEVELRAAGVPIINVGQRPQSVPTVEERDEAGWGSGGTSKSFWFCGVAVGTVKWFKDQPKVFEWSVRGSGRGICGSVESAMASVENGWNLLSPMEKSAVIGDPKVARELAEYRHKLSKVKTVRSDGTFSTPGSGSGSVEWEFNVHYNDWFREGGPNMDSMWEACKLPAYQKIIALGWPVVPLIINLLRGGDNPGRWEIALTSITGASPATMVGQPRMLMPREFGAWRQAWIDWWDTHEANPDARRLMVNFGVKAKEATEAFGKFGDALRSLSGAIAIEPPVPKVRYSLPPIISRRRRIVDALLLAGTAGAWAAAMRADAVDFGWLAFNKEVVSMILEAFSFAVAFVVVVCPVPATHSRGPG